MNKDLDYYLSLPYEIVVEDDQDEIILSMPQLGRAAVTGCGKTYAEAKESLKAVQAAVLEIMLKRGIAIPEPPVVQPDVVHYTHRHAPAYA